MSITKTQIGTSITADFEENSWTFEMSEGFSMSAGQFAILPTNRYNALIEALEEISRGEGAYNEDRLEHANNTIENVKSIAIETLKNHKS